MTEIIEQAVRDILTACTPRKVILYAEKRTMATDKLKAFSLCVILSDDADAENMDDLRRQASTVDVPVSLSVYTIGEWDDLISDKTSYAAWIARKGRVIYDQTA